MNIKNVKKKPCGCPKRPKNKNKAGKASASELQTFDRIQWLKTHVLPTKLTDRTVRLKYLQHMSEMDKYFATRAVFQQFDDDGNRIF